MQRTPPKNLVQKILGEDGPPVIRHNDPADAYHPDALESIRRAWISEKISCGMSEDDAKTDWSNVQRRIYKLFYRDDTCREYDAYGIPR